jgi:hypothetical protein
MNGASFTAAERELLLTQFGALRSDEIRDFMRDKGIGPLRGRKDELIDRVAQALRKREVEVNWEGLIDFLDGVEPYNKQHVILYKVSAETGRDWQDSEMVAALLREHGLGELWQSRVPLAAPEQVTLSSVRLDDGVLEIYAIARRSYPVRRKDREEGLMDEPRFEARVYENVQVRTWIRLRWMLASGEASLHIAQLPRKGIYEATREEFFGLLRGWFPVDVFDPLNLSQAVSRLEEAEINGAPEARVQAVGHNSRGGLRSNISSGAAEQSVFGESSDYDDALKTLHDAGPGSGGSFYFLPPAAGGPAGTPLSDEIHVVIVVKDDRINFPQPTNEDHLNHVLRRVRILAT